MGHSAIFPARYDQIPSACDFIAKAAARAGFDADEVFKVQLACDEACTNVVEHAYGEDPNGKIQVGCAVKGNKFIVTIRDHGRPFDPADVPPPSPPPNPDDYERLKVGGLGLHLMRKIMDDVRFTFDEKKGNTLTMVKQLPEKGKG